MSVKFRYTATAPDGRSVEGTIDASSDASARAELSDQGLLHIELTAVATDNDSDDGNPVLDRLRILGRRAVRLGSKPAAGHVVPRAELLNFTYMLAVFAEAGESLPVAVSILAEDTHNRRFRKILNDVAARLRSGETISEACGAHPDVFDPLYVASLRSGEMVGSLDETLHRLANHIEREDATRNRVAATATYPIIVLVLATVAGLFLTGYAFPRIVSLFDQIDPANLPVLPRTLMAVSDWLQDWWMWLAGGFAGLVVAVLVGRQTRTGQHLRDRMLLRIPLVRRVTRALVFERFCLALSALLRAGVPVPQSMDVAGAASGNRVYEQAIDQVRSRLMQGDGLAGPMRDTGKFPSRLIQLVRTGEESGSVADQLAVAGRYYGEEAVRRVDRAARIGEPLMLLGAASSVGVIAIALVQVMYGIYDQIPGF